MNQPVVFVFSQILELVRAVKGEQVLCFPTETTYGIGGLAVSESATRRIFAIKGRQYDQPLPVICGSWEQVERCVIIEPYQRPLLEAFWPGPLTAVLPARIPFPAGVVDAQGNIAVRITGHALLRALVKHTGPISATSANQSGQPAATSAVACLPLAVDAVLHDDDSTQTTPSTIITWQEGRVVILREGALNKHRLEQFIASATT
ncbi:L-threonylcarbamoyladenylate synthase [Chrysiogenes arsenatis]|uniref:L-threonylcarbamoyladenylate synthase n=1 Tax=Chrysiogenes arsenatis TaxID=309797 RepID=UPI00042218F7|nr:L-threonylcarbamoyladenylate synthase [Chrysiogenes arsenatis]